jgi:hypothetical protein
MDSGYASGKRHRITDRRPSGSSGYRRVNAALNTAAAVVKLYRSFGTQTNNSEGSAAAGVTTQNDKSVQYKAKRISKKLKRKLKWNRKVIKATKSNIGTRTAVFNTEMAGTQAAGVATQFFNWACLHGNNGDTDTTLSCGARDIALLASRDVLTDSKANSFYISTAILDFTFTNSGEAPLEVDVYTVQTRKTANHLGSPAGELVAAEADTPTIGVSYSALTAITRGATLFDFPLFARRGNKILTKTKHFVSPDGGVFTGQMKINRYARINNNMVTTNDPDYTYPGLTKYYVFQVKKVSGFAGSAAAWSIGTTRKYCYKPSFDQTVEDGTG